jgi:hypothetical protein
LKGYNCHEKSYPVAVLIFCDEKPGIASGLPQQPEELGGPRFTQPCIGLVFLGNFENRKPWFLLLENGRLPLKKHQHSYGKWPIYR